MIAFRIIHIRQQVPTQLYVTMYKYTEYAGQMATIHLHSPQSLNEHLSTCECLLYFRNKPWYNPTSKT